MNMVAVTTLRDAAGARVAEEMLADRGIPVEIRRLGYNAYFGAPTSEEFEVRVPEDRADEAHALLDGMAEELERAALAEAGVPPAAGDERGAAELPPPELRPRKLSWAVALSMLMPLAGAGCLYARASRIGWTLAGLTLALWVAAIAGNPDVFPVIGIAKLVDVALAPILAARFNRRLEEHDAPRS